MSETYSDGDNDDFNEAPPPILDTKDDDFPMKVLSHHVAGMSAVLKIFLYCSPLNITLPPMLTGK